MLSLRLRFPTGRYHATPWGHHVNEALVEWPPSPWRLSRALLATWYLKAFDDIAEDVVRGLLEKLAMEPPHFFLPGGQPFHTRHYVRIGGEDTTKIFDAFLHVGDAVAYVSWPSIELDPQEHEAIQCLASRLTYLGRAESWVEAEVVTEVPEDAPHPVRPASQETSEHEEVEIVQVLAPTREMEFSEWRTSWVDRRITEALVRKGRDKLSTKERAKAIEDLPADPFEALHADTGSLRKRGWSTPPGSTWIGYRRPRGLLTPRQAPPPRRKVERHPTVARFAIASDVPPQLTECLHVAENLRRYVLGVQGRLLGQDRALPVFVGRDEEGPLRGHAHVHVLLEPGLEHGIVGHVSFHAPMGFCDDAQRVLRGLRTLWRRDDHDLQLVLLGFGDPSDFGGNAYREGQSPIFAASRSWTSVTPFVATRHHDRRDLRDPLGFAAALRQEVRVQLEARGIEAPPLSIELAAPECEVEGWRVPWRRFKTRRIFGDGRRGNVPPIGLRLVFDEAVRGPICLGYGAHFGLGLFAPEGAYGRAVLRHDEER